MPANIPYLGSKISLLSKSEIRYEGILYTIDSKESTVALANVKLFGTEDRPTARPVPPRDEIYDYIIFRASDIKDLHVCEVPQYHHGLPHDPAIVEHSQQYSLPLGSSCTNFCGVQPFPHLPTSLHQMPIISNRTAGPSRYNAPSQRKSPTSDAGVQVSVGNDFGQNSREPLKPRNRDDNRPTFQNRRRPNSMSRQQDGRRNMSRGGGRGRSDLTSAEKFENEYDFEQANAEFQELENKLSKSPLEGTNVLTQAELDEMAAYNKEKSFFDDISCEATQISKGLPRFDWRYERKLNIETFGVSATNAWLRRRRSRGVLRRGFRGRGGSSRLDNRSNRSNEATVQKTVTFDDTPEIKEVEVVNLEEVPAPIPVIEVVVDKDQTVWPEGGKVENVWEGL